MKALTNAERAVLRHMLFGSAPREACIHDLPAIEALIADRRAVLQLMDGGWHKLLPTAAGRMAFRCDAEALAVVSGGVR